MSAWAQTTVDGVVASVDPEDPARLRYVSTAPSIVRAPNGGAAATVLAVGTEALLTATLQVDAPSAVLESLRARHAATIEVEPTAVVLEPAVAAVGPIDLLCSDGDAPPWVLVSVTTSGYPPWTAVVSTPLDAAAHAAVSAALDRHTSGRLLLAVDVVLRDGSRRTLVGDAAAPGKAVPVPLAQQVRATREQQPDGDGSAVAGDHR